MLKLFFKKQFCSDLNLNKLGVLNSNNNVNSWLIISENLKYELYCQQNSIVERFVYCSCQQCSIVDNFYICCCQIN